MKRVRIPRKMGVVAVLLSVVMGLVWQLTPLQAIVAIASLSDPDKLATLGERGANPRLNKIVFWMHESFDRGGSPEAAVEWAQRLNGESGLRAELVHDSLMRNWKIARELGLLTSENLDKLKRGNAAEVTYGPYAGESVEIDHIVPFSIAPEVGNELANLEMLPRTVNRKKSDKVTDRQVDYAEKLQEAGLLSEGTLEKVRQRLGK
ncbi:MAG: hypothetical protein K0Q55_3339 [Verrucomicrobia bacterium]|jgi:hypothetical protein|nr:hypothetical protein [Verrucomicrobiota bacterium]